MQATKENQMTIDLAIGAARSDITKAQNLLDSLEFAIRRREGFHGAWEAVQKQMGRVLTSEYHIRELEKR